MSCVACGKSVGFNNDGSKFCSQCSASVHKRRKCEVPDCEMTTEAFYTHCTFHYHRLQKEMRLARDQAYSQRVQQQQQQQARPYKSTTVAPVRRRVSRSPPAPAPLILPPPATAATTRKQTVHITKTQTLSSPRTEHTAAKGESRPLSPRKTTSEVSQQPSQQQQQQLPPVAPNIDAAQATRRIMKRGSESSSAAAAAATETTTAPAATVGERQTPQARRFRSMNPNVIVEYECGACAARNVVTREVRFLQTFVARDCAVTDEHGPCATVPSSSPPPPPPSSSSLSLIELQDAATAHADQLRDEDAEHEVEAILNCKDTSGDDCEFQVNISSNSGGSGGSTSK